ncbi:MAG TPA: mannosyltransferase family protein [Ktedonobacteraceae bacterium]|nr:mannosyltransferase family protein [Ktedonobacteraceae bacterium]
MQDLAVDEETQKRLAIKKTENVEVTKTPAWMNAWWTALKQILPIYISLHVIIFILNYMAALFLFHNYQTQGIPSAIHSMLNFWMRWDTVHYVNIATYGYTIPQEAAFFPLYPSLIYIVSLVTGHAFLSGFLVSNVLELGMFTVCYRLIAEDFDEDRAWRCVLYLAIFPTAFFFTAVYTESLFLFLALLSFYYMRRGRWWLAGLAMFFAGLTRTTSVALAIPFCYEYLRQHDFQWKKFRLNILSGAGIVGGIAVFALFCYLHYHDPLLFSHGERKFWGRVWMLPGKGFLYSLQIIHSFDYISFFSIHNMLDLSIALTFLVLLVLCFIGPWKFSRQDWAYPLYGVTIYLFCISVPQTDLLPLASLSRYMLEILPVFILLATMGKNRNFNLFYITLSLPLFAFLLLQFLTGSWMV